MQRINYSSGAPLEAIVGYSRMVKVGDHIYIGGTTSVQPDGTVFGETPFQQADYIFRKFLDLLKMAEAGAEEVIMVKAYITNMEFAKEVGEAFSIYFKKVLPLFTMVETPKLNRPTQYVEIELQAIVGCKVEKE